MDMVDRGCDEGPRDMERKVRLCRRTSHNSICATGSHSVVGCIMITYYLECLYPIRFPAIWERARDRWSQDGARCA